MSDQAQSSKSEVPSWSTFSKDKWYWNPDGKHTEMLKKDVSRLGNVDVYNVYDQGFTTTITSGQSLVLSSAEDIVNFKMEISIELNPIGALQELCVARHYHYPIYTFSADNLNTHNPRFNVKCLISHYISSGTASTKKGAKKKAAYEMYKQIEKIPSEDVHEIFDNECEHKDASEKIVSSVCHEFATQSKIFFDTIGSLKSPHLQSIENNSNKCKLTAADTLNIISERKNSTVELNPITLLQELCIACHVPFPIYTFSADNLNTHNPRFYVKCLVSHYISSGTALTKKGAKTKAAYEMCKQIEKIASEDVHEIIDNECEHKDASEKIVSSVCHESATQSKTFFGAIGALKTPHLQSIENNSNKCKLTAADTLDIISERENSTVELNPITLLQELCISCHFPFPIYNFSVDNLNTHKPTFDVECSLLIYTSSGTASTKKEAKKKAAYEMYKQIEKIASEDVHEIIDNECEHKDASEKIVSSVCHESATQSKTFFGAIGALKTPHLQSIENNSNKCKLTAVDTLKIISERENFTFCCMVISQNSDNVTVLMQANTSPVIVLSESGKNENDAKESAARVLLAYLKSKLRIY